MPKNFHNDAMFRGNRPGHGIKIFNAGTHDIEKNHVVCFYASDAVTVYGISQIESTALGQGNSTISKNWGRKVLGVSQETIVANGGSGVVQMDGFVQCSVAGAVSPLDYLRLSPSTAGVAIVQDSSYPYWEEGYIFGISLSSNSTTVNMFLFPWRY